jgi:hypothetical protein
MSGCLSTKSKDHSEWQLPIFVVHSIMMEKSSPAGEGGGGRVHAHSILLYYHHIQSCSVRSSWESRYCTLTLLHLYPICTLWQEL